MALLPQDPRSQKLFVVTLLAVAAAALFYQYRWSPKNEGLTAIETHVKTLDSLNRAAKLDAARGNAAKMRAEADAYARQLSVMRRLVPTENEVPALLDAVSESARRVGLEFADVVPDGVVVGDQYDTYRYRIGIYGPYHKVAEFLTNIGSLPRIVAPINVTLNPTARLGERKPKKDEQFLEARMQIQTFVAHTSAKAPAGAGAQ
jgi:type IV pilus assembly protein PilO